MSRFAQFGLAALLATSAFAAPAEYGKRDVVTVYVTAPYPGPTAQPAPVPAPVPNPVPVTNHKPTKQAPSLSNKAGIPYNDGALTQMFAGSKVSWAYNWVSSPQGLCSSLEYTPMLHDLSGTFTSVWQNEASAAIASGSKYLMGFNEPDINNGGGTGISVGDAIAGYKQYLMPFAGKAKLVTPGVTNGPDGLPWLQQFVAGCTGCQIDAIAVHWYDQATNVPYFKSYLQQVHAAFPGKKIWLSEFGAYGSDDQVSSFLDQVQPWMDSLPWLQRYAYFAAQDGKLCSGNALSSYGAKYANL